MQVSSPERILPGLADYLTSPKAAMAEGKVTPAYLYHLPVAFSSAQGQCLTVTTHMRRLQLYSGQERPCKAAVEPPAWKLQCVWPLWEFWTRALRHVKQAQHSCLC